MVNRTGILASLLVLAAACGDDAPKNNDAGNGDAGGTCATAPLSITSVPGMVTGTVKDAGADLSSPEGSCTDEFGYYEPSGEDTVVAVSGLTPGMKYGLTLQSESDDLSLYITASCPPATGMVTGCSTFTDEAVVFLSNDPEVIAFTATASTHYVVIDTGTSAKDLTDGNFQLDIEPATCGPQTEQADCSAGTPYCVEFGCRQCVSGFDCAAATPSCDTSYTCVAGPMMCTGDDTRDEGGGDDGPTVASMIATPTAVTPTVITGGVCNTPVNEQDWYKIDIAANQNLSFSLTFTGATNDVDLYLLNSEGQIEDRSENNAGIAESILTDGLAAGSYYVVVTQYAPQNTAAAVAYTLTAAVPECDPEAFPLPACNTAAEPVCNAAGSCAAGPATCTGDTDGEPNDDGPAGGRTLTAGNLNGQICTMDGAERDFYKFTIAVAGSGQTINLAWADTAVDLDLYIVDGTGKTFGQSFYGTGTEQVVLTNLAAGTYYARVEAFVPQGGTASLVSTPYTINSTTTGVTLCTGTRTCGTEYKTQLYRGTCNVNVCSFIAGAGAVAQGGACDSTDDCMGGRCSYIPFEADAQKSVCGPMTCTADAMCTAVDANLRCTTGNGTSNFCHPVCATDLECGARVSSTAIDPGEPWNYFTCTVATGSCSLQ